MNGDAPSSGCMASSTDQAASKAKQLFVSFWHVGLENIPEGTFVHRRLAVSQAKQMIDAARSDETLACVSHDDLLAPYHEDERRKHDELCEVLREHHGVALSFEDFLLEDQDDETHMVRPLVFADIGEGNRLLIVNCHYALASERQKGALEFEIAVDSVTFHLLEAQAGEV